MNFQALSVDFSWFWIWVCADLLHMEGGSSSREEPWLKLGLPGTEDWPHKSHNKDEPSLSFGCFSAQRQQPPCSEMVGVKDAAPKTKGFPADTVVPSYSSQKRTAPAAVVGWPPIRSFRKNLASSANHAKAAVPESQNAVSSSKLVCEKSVDRCTKGMFVKINMDGVPIGRKVDLKAYDSYEKLSTAVDELFRGLLAAQRDSSAGGIHSKQEEQKPITGLLDGRGEYTLVYEDYEGDRMLVGDVPWQMFASNVKRLRVLKSSELSVLSFGGRKQENMAAGDSALK